MYWVIFRRPDSPSFFHASSVGDTVVINWIMIDAEMYGMMLSAKIVMRPSAPPAKTLKMPRMPPDCCCTMSDSTVGSIPGIGM